MKRTTIVEIISALLVLLFVYAAVSKLIDYKQFSLQLSRSPVISSFSKVLAVAIPASELIIVALLLRKATRLQGLFASIIILALFTIYLAGVLGFSKGIPCSCGGILQGLSWGAHIVFNLFFIVIAMVGNILLWQQRYSEPEPVGWSTISK